MKKRKLNIIKNRLTSIDWGRNTVFLTITRYLFIIMIFSSCSKKMVAQGKIDDLRLNQKIQIEGLEREYHLYLPESPKAKPLVLLLHGNGGNFNEVAGLTKVRSPQKVWLSLAKQNDFIVVIPNGSRGSKNKRGWNDCRGDAQGNPMTDDVLYITEILKSLEKKYRFNTKKIYVAGISNGGHMAMRLALEISDKITAFAAVVASMPMKSKCKDSKSPISALFMNGTDDPIMPFEGGEMAGNRGNVKSTLESIVFWTDRNETDKDPIELTIKDRNKKDKSTAIKYLYKNGRNQTEVALYKIFNGGHTEPSVLQRYRRLFKLIVGNQNADFEMANEIWNFFKNKSK